MNNYFSTAVKVIFALGIFVIFVLVSQQFGVNWGKLELAPTSTVTVTGQADGQQLSQVATFRASISEENEDKQVALDAVNEAMTELISQLKDFGIKDQDLKTEQVSVYQYSEPEILIYPPRPSDGKELWQASNSVSVTLRDVDRSSELATLLTESGAADVFGPNFTVDNTTDLEKQLLEQAMIDAREKAEVLLTGTNQQLKRVVSISEAGSNSAPMVYRDLAVAESSVPIEPGSQTLSKTITVVFEISR